MGKSVNIQVARDHLERLTKANGTNALMELIWNSLDADSKNITVSTKEGSLGITQITIEDNGNGINYKEAEVVFGTLGGSAKKIRRLSPGNRKLHGEEGKGRFKSLSLGNNVKFESVYQDNDQLKYFDITIDANNIQGAEISDVKTLQKGKGSTGVKVTLNNVNQDCASIISTDKIYKQIEEKLAVYYLAYPDFNISINKRQLDFQHFIIRRFEDDFKVNPENTEKEIPFKIRILEWSIQNDRNIFLCNQAGISYAEIPLRIKAPSFNISIYILSDYIDEIQKTGNIDFGENEPVVRIVIDAARDIARKYVRDRMHEDAKSFIEEAKKEGIYPYHGKASSEIETVQRKVFDILALNINEYVPKFSEQEKENKKFTFCLVKEALESDSKSLQKIISEAIKMPKTKQDELAEILEKTSLADITTAIKEVSDRLRVLYELKLILLEPKTRDKVLERKHLHQIVKHNTWVFGDDYSLGVEDVNLKNVLKSHLQLLGRDDFQEVLDEKDNDGLKDIPDICLYKQFPRGKAGYFENFVLELKRPSKKSGITELDQVKRYAQAISTDGRFDMKKNEWTVVLLVTEMDSTLEFEYEQDGKPLGEIIKKKNLTVLVKKWIDVLTDAESRYQYLKEKLNYSISHDEEGIKLLKTRYSEYLPEEMQG